MASGRLVGLDVARCLALLGMVAVHVMPDDTTLHDLAHGRAAALFAVLLGVTLAFIADRPRGWAGVVVRAVLIAVLGLALGELDSGLAVILTYYGVLLLLGLLFVSLSARSLVVLAAAWMVGAPVVSHLVRPHLPDPSFQVPSFESLTDPWQLVSELTFTGYYPVVPWLAYLLVGLAVARLDLTRRSLAAWLAVGGAALAVGATVLSRQLADPLDQRVGAGGMGGVTPTGEHWQWLLVVSPHSATPFDLAQTIGCALAAIGGCLLLVGLVGLVAERAERALTVGFGAGTMTLTLYSLHVVLRTDRFWPDDDGTSAYAAHVLVLVGIGALFVAFERRGPLEWFVGVVSRIVSNAPRTSTTVG